MPITKCPYVLHMEFMQLPWNCIYSTGAYVHMYNLKVLRTFMHCIWAKWFMLLPHVMSCVHTNTMLLVEPYVICELLQCPLYATLVETTIATTPKWMSSNKLLTHCMGHNHNYNYLHLNHISICSGQCTTGSRSCEPTVLLLHRVHVSTFIRMHWSVRV